jgi:hypothetical protein
MMWHYFQRDRNYSRPTWFTKFHGNGVSEGCPYQSHGLEMIPDNFTREKL